MSKAVCTVLTEGRETHGGDRGSAPDEVEPKMAGSRAALEGMPAARTGNELNLVRVNTTILQQPGKYT